MFEERQNELLGVGTQAVNLEESRGYLDRQKGMMLAEREVYRQGLQAQFEREQEERERRRRAFSEQKEEVNTRYNTITNPIPYVYKNPNVLRMFNTPM